MIKWSKPLELNDETFELVDESKISPQMQRVFEFLRSGPLFYESPEQARQAAIDFGIDPDLIELEQA